MTRIIGGTAGGRRLRTPSGPLTRPTSDRVREALFSAVESALGSLSGLRFLDLYAGSGAVGLEAASRGAAAVTLVEQNHRAAALVRQNVAAVGLGDIADIEVVQAPVGRFLSGAGSGARPPGPAGPPYDVVFLDPPYDLTASAVIEDLRALARGRLAADALVVVERSTRTTALAWPTGFEPGRTRTYGETALWYGTWTGEPPDDLRYGHDDLPPSQPAQEP